MIHGWKEWADELPLKLNGMFSFVIWDKVRKTLFLARDRHGEKPLFWGFQKNTFLFSSELAAFKAHRNFEARVDKSALQKYFAHGFIPSPNALYEDVCKLQPGYSLLFNCVTRDVTTSPYWKFRIEPLENPPSFDEAAEEIRHLLLQSVQRRLMSDVPLGVFLSGGVDSSFAAAAIRKLTPARQLNSFSIGFNEKSYDETPYAELVAQSIGSNHHNSTLDLQLAGGLIEDVLPRLDEPISDASLLPTFLARFARTKVKVALTKTEVTNCSLAMTFFRPWRLQGFTKMSFQVEFTRNAKVSGTIT